MNLRIANLLPQELFCPEGVFSPEMAGVPDFNFVVINPQIDGMARLFFDDETVIAGKLELRAQETAKNAVEERAGIRRFGAD